MLGVRRIDMRNLRIGDLCNERKGVNEAASENVLRWYEHVRKIDKNRMIKRIFESMW